MNDRVAILKEVHAPTRVEMYLEEQEAVARETAVSGVEKYLADQAVIAEQKMEEVVEQELIVQQDIVQKEAVEEEIVEEKVLSSVERYLQAQPEPVEKVVELSGVDKYMERQSVLAKEAAIANATGVERYLMSVAD